MPITSSAFCFYALGPARRNSARFLLASVIAVSGLAGCASKSKATDEKSLQKAAFIPAENPGRAQETSNSVTYSVPISSQPEGKIQIISKGIEEIRSRKSDKNMPAVHVTLVVSNDAGSRTWLLDARTQQLRLRDDVTLRPALVKAEAVALPMIEVKPGQTETVELYYAIPKSMQNLVELPGFEMRWQIQTRTKLVSQNTKFDQKFSRLNSASVYPFDRSGVAESTADYPAQDSDAASSNADSHRALREGPEMDPTWWADPFTEFPFPWRDLAY